MRGQWQRCYGSSYTRYLSYLLYYKIAKIFAGSTSNKTRKNGTAKSSATTVIIYNIYVNENEKIARLAFFRCIIIKTRKKNIINILYIIYIVMHFLDTIIIMKTREKNIINILYIIYIVMHFLDTIIIMKTRKKTL